jgi:hypothetical protein
MGGPIRQPAGRGLPATPAVAPTGVPAFRVLTAPGMIARRVGRVVRAAATGLIGAARPGRRSAPAGPVTTGPEQAVPVQAFVRARVSAVMDVPAGRPVAAASAVPGR